jgi:hypothetical protein
MKSVKQVVSLTLRNWQIVIKSRISVQANKTADTGGHNDIKEKVVFQIGMARYFGGGCGNRAIFPAHAYSAYLRSELRDIERLYRSSDKDRQGNGRGDRSRKTRYRQYIYVPHSEGCRGGGPFSR